MASPVIHYTFNTGDISNGYCLNIGTGGGLYDISLGPANSIDTLNMLNGNGCFQVGNGSNTATTADHRTQLRNNWPMTESFSYSFWVKRIGEFNSTNHRLLGATFGGITADIVFASSTQIRQYIGGWGTLIDTDIFTATATYRHFVVTYRKDGNNYKVQFYIDGVNVGSEQTFNYYSGNLSNLTIGAASDNPDPIFNGYFDDFRIFNYAVDENIITILYKLGSNTEIASLSGESLSTLINLGASISQLKTAGISITASEFINAGYTVADLLTVGVVPDWTFDPYANHLAQSYIKDFIDISGSLVLRENANLTVIGNIETSGNLVINNQILEADLSLNHNLSVGGDVSMNGNVTVGGDVTVGGTVVDCSFVDGSIPASAFIGDIPVSEPDYTQPTILYEKGFDTTADVSMNATVQISNLKVDGNIEFSDGTILDSYDDNKIVDYTVRTSNYVAGTGIPYNIYIHDTTDHKSLSSDGKYILVVGGEPNNNPYVSDSNTEKSGICLSSNYGVTYAFFHLKHPDNGTNLTNRSYRTSAMSGDGKYMLVFISGSGSGTSQDMVYGISRNYGIDWTTHWQNTLPGFANTNLFPRTVSLNYDGSKAFIQAIQGGGVARGAISHNFMVDWSAKTTDVNAQESRIIGNFLVCKVDNSIVFTEIESGTRQTYAAKKIGYATAVSNTNDIVVILCNDSVITKLIVNGSNITESDKSSINTENYIVSPMVSPSGKYVVIGKHKSLGSMYNDLTLFTDLDSKVYCSSDYGESFTTVSTGIIGGGFPGVFHTESSVTDTGFIFISGYHVAGKNIMRYGSYSLFKASTFTSLDIVGNLTAGSFSSSSDYRIKTDITLLDQTITIDQLRPVKYLQTILNKHQYGFIAHELQEHFPDLVKGEKDGEPLQSVNYTGLIALLINEIKRLKQELTELENE